MFREARHPENVFQSLLILSDLVDDLLDDDRTCRDAYRKRLIKPDLGVPLGGVKDSGDGRELSNTGA